MSEASRRAAEEEAIVSQSAAIEKIFELVEGWYEGREYDDFREELIVQMQKFMSDAIAQAVAEVKTAPCPVGHEHSYLCTTCAVAQAIEGERERLRSMTLCAMNADLRAPADTSKMDDADYGIHMGQVPPRDPGKKA